MAPVRELTKNTAARILAILPLAFLVFVISMFAVDLARMDEWDFVDYVHAMMTGNWRWGLFFQQANESRPFFPRMVLLLTAWLTNWDTRKEVFVLAGFVALQTFILYKLWLKLHVTTLFTRCLGLGAAFLLTCSPFQIELLWGYQLLFQMTMLGIVLGLYLTQTGLPAWLMTLFIIACCIFSTFCSPNGLAAWPVLFAGLIFARPTIFRRQWWLGVVYGVCFAGTVWFYFRNYVRPPTHPPMLIWHRDFAGAFLALVGQPMGALSSSNTSFVLSFWGGVIALTWCVLGTMWCMRQIGYRATLKATLPLLLVVVFAVISALLATAGRLADGRDSVWPSTRYGAYTTYGFAAVIFLMPIWWKILARDQLPPPTRQSVWRWKAVNVGLAVFFLACQARCYILGYRSMEAAHGIWMGYRAVISISDQVMPPFFEQNVYPRGVFSHRYFRMTRELDMLKPRLSGNGLDSQSAGNEAFCGFTDSVVMDMDGRIKLSGWAYLTSVHRPANAVVVTANIAGVTRPIAVGFLTEIREDVGDIYGKNARSSGWTLAARLPEGATDIQAWAVNGVTGSMWPLVMPVQPRVRPPTKQQAP